MNKQEQINDYITTWGDELKKALTKHGEKMKDIVSSTLTRKQLSTKFDKGYGSIEGCPFTVWTEKRVYFPVEYDGFESCQSVSRHPDGVPTKHVG